MESKPLWNLEKPGKELQPDQCKNIHSQIQKVFKLTREALTKQKSKPGQFQKLQFLGAQCVSFMKKHFQSLKRSRFLVCEKTDGVRYFLFISQSHHTFLINRKNKVFLIQLCLFPEKGQKSLNLETLLDCELVEENDGSISLLVFDALIVASNNTMLLSYEQRLQYALHYIRDHFTVPSLSEPKVQWGSKIDVRKSVGAMVYLKDFFQLKHLQFVMKSVIPKLLHQNDGIIFTDNEWRYQPGKTASILKWKPSQLNTIDFVVKQEFKFRKITIYGLYPDYGANEADFVKGKAVERCRFGWLVPRDQEESKEIFTKLVKNKNLIGECHFTSKMNEAQKDLLTHLRRIELFKQKQFKKMRALEVEEIVTKLTPDEQESKEFKDIHVIVSKMWKLLRFREDKEKANFHLVAESIFECIQEDIGMEELIEEAKKGPRSTSKDAERAHDDEEDEDGDCF